MILPQIRFGHAIIANLYRLTSALTCTEVTQILGTFPLVFPNTDEGAAKKEALMRVYDEYEGQFGR